MKITDAQHAALRWLYNAGNDGLITRGGVVLCGGQNGRFLSETWLRLWTLGFLISTAPLRIRLSIEGLSYCRKHFGEPDVMKTGYEDNACEDGWDDAESERTAA